MRDGDVALANATLALQIDLASLVAATSLWAAPRTFHRLKAIQPDAAWYPETRRFRKGVEQRGQRIGVLRLDDNTYANGAAKQAILGSRDCRNYAVCHVWPGSCYDARYHTCIANLVLVPTAIAGLTDHDERTRLCIQFRAYELFGWRPVEEPIPERPADYPTNWISPTESIQVEKRLTRLENLAATVSG